MFNLVRKDRNVFLPFGKIFKDFFEYPLAETRPFDWVPSLDISETQDEILVKIELPGVKAEDLDITIKGDQLVVKGEKKEEKEEEGKDYHHVERVYGSFQRSVLLPGKVDA